MAKDSKVYDKFINMLIEEQTVATIFLINGVKLQGILEDFDEFSITLKRDQQIQLICRNAISTIIPQYKTNNS